MKKIFSIVCACLVMMGANAMPERNQGMRIVSNQKVNTSNVTSFVPEFVPQVASSQAPLFVEDDAITINPNIAYAMYMGSVNYFDLKIEKEEYEVMFMSLDGQGNQKDLCHLDFIVNDCQFLNGTYNLASAYSWALVAEGDTAKNLTGSVSFQFVSSVPFTDAEGVTHYLPKYQVTATATNGSKSFTMNSEILVQASDLYYVYGCNQGATLGNGQSACDFTDIPLLDDPYIMDASTKDFRSTFTEQDCKIVRDDFDPNAFAIVAENATNYADIQFNLAQEDPNTIIPVGTYNITNDSAMGTVLASSGYNFATEEINMSVAGTSTDLWFIAEGTVTVTANNGILIVVVEAKNTRSRVVNISMRVNPNNTPVENVEAEVNAAAKRIDANGQLIINRNGVDYNVLGF